MAGGRRRTAVIGKGKVYQTSKPLPPSLQMQPTSHPASYGEMMWCCRARLTRAASPRHKRHAAKMARCRHWREGYLRRAGHSGYGGLEVERRAVSSPSLPVRQVVLHGSPNLGGCVMGVFCHIVEERAARQGGCPENGRFLSASEEAWLQRMMRVREGRAVPLPADASHQ
jgi:hypothetical protein